MDINNIHIFGYNQTTCDAPWPAYIFFTKGCNLQCPYCHNKTAMWDSEEILPEVINDTIKQIASNPLIKGIIISGGEPTLQPDLINFLRSIKKMYPHILIKLDTNGTKPSILSEIIRGGLVDFIAMDIKLPFERYEELRIRARLPLETELGTLVRMSADLIKRSHIEHEFRITVDPDILSHKELKYIRKQFPNIKVQKKMDR